MTLDCAAARERLLEAEPEELDGTAETPLARHLAACAPCAARAHAILEGEAALDRALGQLSRTAVSGDVSRPPSSRIRRIARWAAVPLVAAAAVAVVWSVTSGPPPPAIPDARVVLEEPVPFVEAPEGRPVGVFQTGQPGITVVWFF